MSSLNDTVESILEAEAESPDISELRLEDIDKTTLEEQNSIYNELSLHSSRGRNREELEDVNNLDLSIKIANADHSSRKMKEVDTEIAESVDYLKSRGSVERKKSRLKDLGLLDQEYKPNDEFRYLSSELLGLKSHYKKDATKELSDDLGVISNEGDTAIRLEFLLRLYDADLQSKKNSRDNLSEKLGKSKTMISLYATPMRENGILKDLNKTYGYALTDKGEDLAELVLRHNVWKEENNH